MRNHRWLDKVAGSLDSPADLGETGLENLLNERALYNERAESFETRGSLRRLVLDRFAAWFKARQTAEELRRKRANAECDRQYKAQEKRDARNELCLEADFHNLATCALLERRGWTQGTARELELGLDTPEKRHSHRLEHGITWDCAGFGPYYERSWSAARCALKYEEDARGFLAVYRDPRFAEAWSEIDEVMSTDEYRRDPFKVRDPRLPIDPAAAKALAEKVEAGEAFADAVSNVAATTPSAFPLLRAAHKVSCRTTKHTNRKAKK